MRFHRLLPVLASLAFLGACSDELPTDNGAVTPTIGSAPAYSTGVGSVPEVSGSVVLDFEELATGVGPGVRVPAPYLVQGYVLHTSAPTRFFSPASTFRWYGGSAALFVDDIRGVEAILTREDGSSFSVSSIDLARLFGTATAEVTFIGTTRGGGTVQQTVPVTGLAFETFPLSGFDDLIELRWSQATGFSPKLHQFDDIALTLANPGSRAACREGGWQAFGFGNHGECIAFIASGHDPR